MNTLARKPKKKKVVNDIRICRTKSERGLPLLKIFVYVHDILYYFPLRHLTMENFKLKNKYIKIYPLAIGNVENFIPFLCYAYY